MHIDSVVAKAHQRANAILRCFITCDAELLTTAFTVYVRPILELVRGTMVRGVANLSYCDRLCQLDLCMCSLELQWLYFKQIHLCLCFFVFLLSYCIIATWWGGPGKIEA